MDSHYHSVLLFLFLSAELIQEDSWLNDSMISLRWTFFNTSEQNKNLKSFSY